MKVFKCLLFLQNHPCVTAEWKLNYIVIAACSLETDVGGLMGERNYTKCALYVLNASKNLLLYCTPYAITFVNRDSA